MVQLFRAALTRITPARHCLLSDACESLSPVQPARGQCPHSDWIHAARSSCCARLPARTGRSCTVPGVRDKRGSGHPHREICNGHPPGWPPLGHRHPSSAGNDAGTSRSTARDIHVFRSLRSRPGKHDSRHRLYNSARSGCTRTARPAVQRMAACIRDFAIGMCIVYPGIWQRQDPLPGVARVY